MRWWSGSVLALALMLWSIGVGHAFTLGPSRASAGTVASPEPSSPGGDETDPAEEMRLTPIPEPSTMLLFSSGLAGLAVFGSRARSRTR